MRTHLRLSRGIRSAIRTLFLPKKKEESAPEKSPEKGEGLTSLHEFQHQVIIGLFKINFAGLLAFFLIVFSFTLFAISDPLAPGWVGIMLMAVGVVLLIGFYRAFKEYRFYRVKYQEFAVIMKEKLRRYSELMQASSATTQQPKTYESRLLSALKPREYGGWDAKVCSNCKKNIELLASVCQHCGHEQGTLLVN